MNILALDPASVTGYAHSNGRYGSWRLTVSGSEHEGNRLIRLEDRLLQAHGAWQVGHIAFERAAYGGDFLATKQFHNQLRGVILLVAAKIGATWSDYSPSTIKKFATNHGHASKQDMLRALRIQLGITDVVDHNIADAIWILELAKQEGTFARKTQSQSRPARRRKAPRRLF